MLELLCLNAAEHVPKLPARLPHPSECELYYINRDTLFSYHKVCHCCSLFFMMMSFTNSSSASAIHPTSTDTPSSHITRSAIAAASSCSICSIYCMPAVLNHQRHHRLMHTVWYAVYVYMFIVLYRLRLNHCICPGSSHRLPASAAHKYHHLSAITVIRSHIFSRHT